MKYKVYFEFFGKKFKTEVEAESKQKATDIIRNRVSICKIEEIENTKKKSPTDIFNDILEILK